MIENLPFALESKRRISEVVQRVEKLEWNQREIGRVISPKTPQAPQWDVIANEQIAAGATGVVELLKSDRSTRTGQTVVAYNPATEDIGLDSKGFIIWVSAPEADANRVSWYFVPLGPGDPGNRCIIQLSSVCTELQPGSVPDPYTVSWDSDAFEEKAGGDPANDLGWLIGGDHVLRQNEFGGNLICQWNQEGTTDGGTNYDQSNGWSGPGATTRFQLVWDIFGTSYRLIAETEPEDTPANGLADRDILFTSFQNFGTDTGFQPKATVSPGDVVGRLRAGQSANPCDLLRRIEALEAGGRNPVNP